MLKSKILKIGLVTIIFTSIQISKVQALTDCEIIDGRILTMDAGIDTLTNYKNVLFEMSESARNTLTQAHESENEVYINWSKSHRDNLVSSRKSVQRTINSFLNAKSHLLNAHDIANCN